MGRKHIERYLLEEKDKPSTIGKAREKIRSSGVDFITGHALLAHVTGRPKEWLLAHADEPLEAKHSVKFNALLARAAQGEPLAYLTGEKEFCGLVFMVTPAVLIPRPETEMLVELAEKFHHKDRPHIVDVGTGSGAIAVSIAERPWLWADKVVAIDSSDSALAIAKGNAVLHGVEDQIQFIKGDLLAYVDETFDIILANLPYIPTETLIGLEVSHWEPAVALDGGEDGLDLIRRLVDQATTRLSPGGMLALEIQFDQGERVSKLCRAAFPNADVSVLKDLAGLDRVVKVELSNPV